MQNVAGLVKEQLIVKIRKVRETSLNFIFGRWASARVTNFDGKNLGCDAHECACAITKYLNREWLIISGGKLQI